MRLYVDLFNSMSVAQVLLEAASAKRDQLEVELLAAAAPAGASATFFPAATTNGNGPYAKGAQVGAGHRVRCRHQGPSNMRC